MALIDILLAPASEESPLCGRYDETRSLTLAKNGFPLVSRPLGETHEITEISGEHDEPPPELPPGPPPDLDEEIRTFVERETDAFSDSYRVIDAMRTETFVERERPDRDEWS
jgi:hypothetical protein